MSNKIFVRKCERYTVWEATKPIEVNVEKLRNCEPPYEGETNEDLLGYLTSEVWNNEEFYNNDTNKEIYGEDEIYDLSFEDSFEMEPYSDSRNEHSEDWLDIGIPNEEYSKYGGFEVKATGVE